MNFPSIEALLLHRGSMLLLDRVLDFKDQKVAVEYAPRREAWYVDAQGHMPAWIGIELMAQAVAVHVALSKRLQNLPMRLGVLLGTRRFDARQAAISADTVLCIEATEMFRDESGLGAYECRILSERLVVAEATLKVYEPSDAEQFLQQEQTS